MVIVPMVTMVIISWCSCVERLYVSELALGLDGNAKDATRILSIVTMVMPKVAMVIVFIVWRCCKGCPNDSCHHHGGHLTLDTDGIAKDAMMIVIIITVVAQRICG